jgi:formamidopyrimidine-DNA glycosylase
VPEGDTVYLAATRLNGALAGRKIVRSDLRVPRYATADVSGATVREVVPRGKHLLFHFDNDTTLHTHFKMEGTWHLYRHGERWRGGPAHEIRALLETESWVAVGYRLGIVELLSAAQEDELVSHLGPDVLGSDWDAAEVLERMLKEPSRPIGDVLLDQTVIAGPGNVYKCEVCFLRGVHPDTSVGDVTDLPALVDLVKKLMDVNRTTGSQITTGDARPGRKRWVYGRGRQPCRRCGTLIARRDEPGERVTYWCPSCQPLIASGRGPI